MPPPTSHDDDTKDSWSTGIKAISNTGAGKCSLPECPAWHDVSNRHIFGSLLGSAVFLYPPPFVFQIPCSNDSFQSNHSQQIVSPVEYTIMVFYAYVKQITDNSTYRYVITFASREVADEWWRAVSTSTVTTFVTSVLRVNAQFYTHNVNVANAANSLTTTGVATQFLGEVFFTLDNDLGGRGLSIIPRLEHFADRISGNSFFIRSKVAPHDYWYYPTSSNTTKAVYVSRTERTRFTVSLSSGTAGTVMIGSDDIVITLTTADLSVNVDATSGQVILSLAPLTTLTLSTLLTNFTVGSSLSVNNETVKELLYTVNGEEWELA